MAGNILVIGATGTVGGHLVARLEQQGEAILAATREPQRAARNTGGLTRYVAFDFERPETFAPALDGADRVFLMARPGDEQADRVALPLIDEMKRRRIRRVVNLTAMGVETREDFALRKVERALEDSGLGFTHLRPNFFMQLFAGGPLLQDIQTTEALHLPAADARISYIDVRDIADVATAALTRPGHDGQAYTLTGPRALHHDEVAQALSDAAGRTIRYVPIDEDAARRKLADSGLAPPRVERLMGFYRLVRQGFCAPVSSAIETVLGRPPLSFSRFARDHAACWTRPSA